jgi:hypothetical protein
LVSVRIRARHLNKIKYIAAYQVAPVAAITHIAQVASISPYNDTGKYLLRFKGPATTFGPIPTPQECEANMQSARCAVREKLVGLGYWMEFGSDNS